MALAPGTRLGPYEILTAIGAGGMGEVYKARDTRLDRAVAVKVIQSAVASHPEIRERFEREARAISALDHPHICMLYDVCREDVAVGAASAGGSAAASTESVSFLVMQYLEGETLADRLARAGKPPSDPNRPPSGVDSGVSTISRGPIPFETALKYAAQIADALDAAHRRGIVHRDLKPGNVMLTKAGTKLLDFGLAKLAQGDGGIAGLGGDGATRTSPFGGHQVAPLTSQGAILGTLQYMSPEQLEGRDIDTRSDIFAFGALLFEMLSGRRAFEGQSQAGIIAAIIGGDAPPLTTLADVRTTLPVVAHRALDRLLGKCLAKNPDDRWQSAADLASELQWINEERLRAVAEPAGAASAIGTTVDYGSRRRERTWMAIAAAAVVALAAVAVWWYPRPAPPAEPVSFPIAPPEGQTLSNGPGLLSVSPDGRRIAFTTGLPSDSLQLWVRTMGSLVPERLDRAAGAWQPFWSPDGRFIAFVGGSGSAAPLRKIDLTGGAPMTLAPEALGRGAWSREGVILFVGPGAKLYRLPESGGQPAVEMELDPARREVALAWPMFLPDGRRYIFNARSADNSKHAFFLATLGAPGRTHLVDGLSNIDYAAGHLFYQREGTLVAHPFDADAGRITGDAFPVVENVRYNAANGRGAFSVSPSGVLAYVPGDNTRDMSDRRLMQFDRSGKALRQIGAPGPYMAGVLSPDGRQAVVVHEAGPQESAVRTLALMDIERGVSTRLTVGDVDERNPVWSPDGSSIVYGSTRDSKAGIYRRSAGGGATRDELLFASEDQVAPTGFSKDGQLLLMTRGSGPTQRIWVLPLSGDRKAMEVFPGSTMAAFNAVFSPDDKWIAYAAGTSPLDSDVYLAPYPADERRVRVSTSSGHVPRWTADGRHIIYRANDDALMSVDLTPARGTFQPSAPVPLFTQQRAARFNWFFSSDSDAQRFLLVTGPDEKMVEQAPSSITVIVNWTAGLGKK